MDANNNKPTEIIPFVKELEAYLSLKLIGSGFSGNAVIINEDEVRGILKDLRLMMDANNIKWRDES